MKVSPGGGETWLDTVRDTNNFFKLPGNGGTGTETALIRVTSHTGTQVEVEEVDMASGKKTVAQDNYA
ncbi:hypothetical protein KC349_g8840 [Hortaea werneckii]|nr:hypothetical protein KC349_g8840 [Hortaea werneckii]